MRGRHRPVETSGRLNVNVLIRNCFGDNVKDPLSPEMLYIRCVVMELEVHVTGGPGKHYV